MSLPLTSSSRPLSSLLERDPGCFEPTTAFRVAQAAADGDLAVTSSSGVSPATLTVSGFSRRKGSISVRSTLAALLGPLGSMPPSYNDLVMREDRNRSGGLAGFFELFSARIAELFVDACEKYRIARRLRWGGDQSRNGFVTTLFALTGFGTVRLKEHTAVDDELILRFAGFFSARTRNASNLQAMLQEFSGLPVTVELFHGRWLEIPLHERSRMGQPQGVQLGVNAAAGAAIHDFSGSFRIAVGPLSYRDYLSLAPGGSNISELFAMTRLYVGSALDFDIQVILQKADIPLCQLGGEGDPPRLGWNSWARIAPADRDSGEAIIIERLSSPRVPLMGETDAA